MLREIRAGLLREAKGSALTGEASWSKTGAITSLVIPQASVIGGSGEPLISLSRFQYGNDGEGIPRLAGSIATGGRDLPRIEATIEQQGAGGFKAQLAMATYQAPGGSIAIPSLALVSKDNRIGFAGRAILSGDLPGGHAEGLLLPVSGNWSSTSGLAVWRDCTPVAFDSLRFANLTLQRRGLTICPAKGQPIVRYGPARPEDCRGDTLARRRGHVRPDADRHPQRPDRLRLSRHGLGPPAAGYARPTGHRDDFRRQRPDRTRRPDHLRTLRRG